MDDNKRLAFYKAFGEAQYEYTGTLKNDSEGKAGSGTFKYASLDGIYNIVIPVLYKHGLCVKHNVTFIDGKECMYTQLIHKASGEYFDDTHVLLYEGKDNKKRGEAETYAKKYAIKNLCGIDSSDDDIDAPPDNEGKTQFIKKKLTGADFKHLSTQEALESLVNTLDSAANKRWIIDKLYEHNKVDAIKDIPKENIYSSLAFVVNAKK